MSTIYLSNWSSYRTPGAHGPGRKFSIMARPRSWEWGDGRVEPLARAMQRVAERCIDADEIAALDPAAVVGSGS